MSVGRPPGVLHSPFLGGVGLEFWAPSVLIPSAGCISLAAIAFGDVAVDALSAAWALSGEGAPFGFRIIEVQKSKCVVVWANDTYNDT